MSIKTLALASLLSLGFATPALAAGETVPAPQNDWSWQGPFGGFDEAQLQRGYSVYKNVCAACHSMDLVAFRNLAQAGGPGLSPEQAEVLASEYIYEDVSTEDGSVIERPGTLTDSLPAPYPNEAAARASNGGAYPPDLSVMAKARPDGANYLKALLLGYTDPPADDAETAPVGKYYNVYYPGHWISMANPLSDGVIDYPDVTGEEGLVQAPETVEQYAEDVTAFLMWAAEPKLEERRRVGFIGMTLLIVLAGLLYLTTRSIWRGVKH